MTARALQAGYEAEIAEHRLAFSRGCAITAIVLILAGCLLDYALYPSMQSLFGMARLFFSGLILAIILVMRTPWGEAHARELTFIWLMLPQVMITWMIARTEGASSLYYGGLHLAIFASGLALPFTVLENAGFGILTYTAYTIACVAHPDGVQLRGAFMVNSLFLLMSTTIAAVCTYFNERTRFTTFRLKEEVAASNQQLERTNRELTEIKGQMLQQEKMAALGTLAAGLLHEVNNPVNYSMMAIDIALEEPAAQDNGSLRECLQDARGGMQRVHHIVSDLKTFAYRKSGTELTTSHFLFETALDSALRLVSHETRGMRISRVLPEDTLVRGDEAAIIGVLINLLSNAAHAGRGSGRTDLAIDIEAHWEHERLRVSVRDNGPGIARENLTRVFEPFFTTREVGKGLGLGLAISYSVIERHGGVLTADSVLGEWTRFQFDLPRGT
ncbi:two-component sensor histidine kinase [Massilia arenosa]|uniref:histidine kinase n=1 Tax=Zemynaea arenosa TaxID=2561931 RepID=A0A4Y9S7X3_9BURK|nr:ATP-binding protein [Massilia arenosa]TFW16166.1 two-component sensor histidine kinase [Massilia arenosa]